MPNTIGFVKELSLFPVKSMGGVQVQQARAYWYGLNGDRKFAFVRSQLASGFPWLTGREAPDLLRYRPFFKNSGNHFTSPVMVHTPEGKTLKVTSKILRSELQKAYGSKVHLMQLHRGTFDCMPISVLTTNSVRTVGRMLETPLNPHRFRANLLIETETRDKLPENEWLQRELIFGDRPDSAIIQINYRTTRCTMINLDPRGGRPDTSVLRTVARDLESQLGVYASVLRPGSIHLGDPVYARES